MNMRDIWSKRFGHYMNELQKYMQYIFTGHIGVVLVFVLGALGYQYSEWLKVAPSSFPAEWLVAVVVGFILSMSRPVTLLREPDQVYLLPLESSMKTYFNKALTWTYFSQVVLPLLLFIIAIPLLKAVTDLTIQEIWMGAAFVAVLKMFNVVLEFNYRYANRGHAVWIDRVARIIMNILVLEAYLHGGIGEAALYGLLIIAYYLMIRKKAFVNPVPYEHFVKIEQNRMLGFYRFANYFTEVPHLRGSIKRRAWLDFVYRSMPFKKDSMQSYLVGRTFVRTDDLFYLWVRLTAISAVFAAFIELQFVTWIVSAALVFAMVIQLKQALTSKGEFRMDMLYPGAVDAREKAVDQLLRKLVIIQAVVVTLCNIMMPMFYLTPIVIIVIGFVSIKVTTSK